MAVDVGRAGSSVRGARRRVSGFFWRRSWLKGGGLLLPPLGWIGVVYLAALVTLLLSGLHGVDSFTGRITGDWTLSNFREILSLDDTTYLRIAWHTIWIAGAVTITDAVLAFPIAFYMARVASSRTRAVLFVMVLLPLWSSYIVRVYAWRVILKEEGALNWSLNQLGLPDADIGFTDTAMWLVFSYLWLPFMILPLYAALERVPESYL